MTKLSKQDIQFCKSIMAKAGPTYYWATNLLPKKAREATYVLYAFYRVPDDIVDLCKGDPSQELTEWINQWKSITTTNLNLEQFHKLHPVLRSALQVHQDFNIPFEYSYAFLESMHQDLSKKTYENYQELVQYMYGSASVVGIMMTHIFVQNPDGLTLQKAKSLGEAMQITNFLRDINEDLKDRQRVYMPKDELIIHKINPSLKAIKVNDDWRRFMQFQMQRNVELYREGFSGLKFLPFHIRFCVKLSGIMYMSFLQQIINSDYQVFQSSYRLTTQNKIFNLLQAILNKFNYPTWQKL